MVAAVARALASAFLLLLASIVVLPFAWMLLTSFKTDRAVLSYPPGVWPTEWTLDNYVSIWRDLPFGKLIRNSLIFAGGVTLLSLFFDSIAAYAFARLRFPGRDGLFVLVLVAMMLPGQALFMPVYLVVRELGWLDSFTGLIVPRAASAFGIFMLRQFFMALPRDLDDAARLDGAGEFRIYWSIILPLSKPALLTLAIFHFTNNWNDLLWPLLITSSDEMRTLPAGLAYYVSQYTVDYGPLMAGATIALAPLVLAFLFAQRFFIQGIAVTGLKG